MNVITLFANGFEEIEALTPVDFLRRENIDVKIVALDDYCDRNTGLVTSSHNVSIKYEMLLSEFLASPFDVDAVIIPGGMPGSSNLGHTKEVIDLIKNLDKQNKLICAICAAPIAVLAQTGILQGKNVTCFPGFENNLDDYLLFTDGGSKEKLLKDTVLDTSKNVVQDKNLITANGPKSALEFAFKIIEALKR